MGFVVRRTDSIYFLAHSYSSAVNNNCYINMKYLFLILIVGLASVWYFGPTLYSLVFTPTPTAIPTRELANPVAEPATAATIETLATNLSVPWDIALLPNGDLLLTERTGDLVRVSVAGGLSRVTIPQVSARGEGGLMGLALDPDFTDNRYVYLYRTIIRAGERENEIVRFIYDDAHTIEDETVLLSGIPGATYHDGGALSFGPDGYLYLTTGDAGVPALAQDRNSLAGKILRMTKTGEPAPGNPFNSLVYSYGHRNPQGLAWDSAGQLWSTEHGRSGVQSGLDELNRIEAGGNYGWPDSQGDTVLPGTIAPTLHSGERETWAPASLAISNDTFYFTGLRGQRLYQVSQSNNELSIAAYLSEEYGRLRGARIYGDTLYLTTSNTDGRGSVNDTDDRLLAIPLSMLQ